MSAEAVIWARAIQLPPCPKIVLHVLAGLANEQSLCYPSLDDLLRLTIWKRRSVQRAIRTLVHHKLLTVSPRFMPDGGQLTNLYRLTLGAELLPTSPCIGIRTDRPAGPLRVTASCRNLRRSSATFDFHQPGDGQA